MAAFLASLVNDPIELLSLTHDKIHVLHAGEERMVFLQLPASASFQYCPALLEFNNKTFRGYRMIHTASRTFSVSYNRYWENDMNSLHCNRQHS
jgi:hypothetical protein